MAHRAGQAFLNTLSVLYTGRPHRKSLIAWPLDSGYSPGGLHAASRRTFLYVHRYASCSRGAEQATKRECSRI